MFFFYKLYKQINIYICTYILGGNIKKPPKWRLWEYFPLKMKNIFGHNGGVGRCTKMFRFLDIKRRNEICDSYTVWTWKYIRKPSQKPQRKGKPQKTVLLFKARGVKFVGRYFICDVTIFSNKKGYLSAKIGGRKKIVKIHFWLCYD